MSFHSLIYNNIQASRGKRSKYLGLALLPVDLVTHDNSEINSEVMSYGYLLSYTSQATWLGFLCFESERNSWALTYGVFPNKNF